MSTIVTIVKIALYIIIPVAIGYLAWRALKGKPVDLPSFQEYDNRLLEANKKHDIP